MNGVNEVGFCLARRTNPRSALPGSLIGEIMDECLRFSRFVALALSLIFPWPGLAQNATEKRTLVVNGRAADGAVVQIHSHSYVDVDTLARIMNAAVSLEPGRVILTVPLADAGAKPERSTPGLSKEFARAGISALAEMWEWKGAIASAIRSGVAGGNWLAPWLRDHRVRAGESLSQASLAAKTESDQKALQLLKNQLTNLGEWDSNTQATILSMNGEQTVDPAVAQNDPLLAKISECGNFLNAMLVGGEFADSSTCH
jgi:hypothetical protein